MVGNSSRSSMSSHFAPGRHAYAAPQHTPHARSRPARSQPYEQATRPQPRSHPTPQPHAQARQQAHDGQPHRAPYPQPQQQQHHQPQQPAPAQAQQQTQQQQTQQQQLHQHAHQPAPTRLHAHSGLHSRAQVHTHTHNQSHSHSPAYRQAHSSAAAPLQGPGHGQTHAQAQAPGQPHHGRQALHSGLAFARPLMFPLQPQAAQAARAPQQHQQHQHQQHQHVQVPGVPGPVPVRTLVHGQAAHSQAAPAAPAPAPAPAHHRPLHLPSTRSPATTAAQAAAAAAAAAVAATAADIATAPVSPPNISSASAAAQAAVAVATTLAMADSAYIPSDEELAHLQKLSSEYQPEATGPLVGDRQSSAAIASQYANADPIYRLKTAALPAKYAYFRTCRGDGHCGWRAIAFTYFEALLRVGDADRVDEEEARLQSLGNLLDNIGYSRDIWLDFAEEAYDLLRRLSVSLRNMDGAAADILLRCFNDLGESMAIITYLKLLASAWMQSHIDDFSHFVPMGDVKAYCANNIEPAQCEVDNIAIVALTDVLVKPAGFGIEVWYLDRSPGEEINRSFFAEPVDQQNIPIPNPPMLRLLYRPGHYDILYMASDVPMPIQHQSLPPQESLHVALVNYADEFMPSASNVDDVMTMIPGMYPNGLTSRWPSLSYDFTPSPTAHNQVTPVQPYASIATPVSPISPSHMDFMTPIHSSHVSQYNPSRHHSVHLEQSPVTLPIHPPPPPVSIERVASSPVLERTGPFRPSMYELEPGFGAAIQMQPFQTSIFRNSHFNVAHYQNPHFQPEEWCPDGEYITGNKGRHKSSSS